MRAPRAQLLAQLSSPSLRGRVTLWTALVSLLIQLLLSSLVFFYQWQQTDALYSERLALRVASVSEELRPLGTGCTDALLRELALTPLALGQPDEYVLVLYDSAGGVIAASRRPAPDWADIPELSPLASGLGYAGRVPMPGLLIGTGAENTLRMVVRRIDGLDPASPMLVVARSDSAFEHIVGATASTLVIALVVAMGATVASTWLISGVVLSPLRSLAKVADAFSVQAMRGTGGIDGRMPSELDAFRSELETAQDRLRAVFREQDRLISNLSHEMKTPIAVLLTEAQTLDTHQLSVEQQTFVASVRQEMLRLGATIETFVRLSRVRTGAYLPDAIVSELHDPLLEAVGACSRLAKKRGVTIRAMASDDVEPILVSCDVDLLIGMFTYILTNCIRSSERQAEVRIEVTSDEKHCRVTIGDRGACVPESLLAKLFDHYADSSNECGDRRDLGLSVAQGIAELHGGLISASNANGGGCEFVIRLPRHVVASASLVPAG